MIQLVETPIVPMKDLEKTGNSLYIKREDCLPFSLGGNKVRIAKEFFEDMKQEGADTMILYGDARSNLCRVMANECKREEIPCYMICTRIEEEKETGNNEKMMRLFDAKIIFCDKTEIAETVEELMNRIKKEHHRPYYIYGNKFGKGKEAVAGRAYYKVLNEIEKFEKEAQISFDYIFTAVGTGATFAGLTAAVLAVKKNCQVVGISISREQERGSQIAKDSIQAILKEHKIPWSEDMEGKICFTSQYCKGGYGKRIKEVVEGIRQEFSYNGIPLDPTYTGKAMWGMKEYLKEQKIQEKNILFLHTGGIPLFFDDLQIEGEEEC